MKRLLIASLTLLLPLTGCAALREPTDMFVIAGTALAWQDGQYSLASEMGDTGSTQEDLPKSRVFSGAGDTVSACLFDMAARAEREIYFGKTEVLLLQETMPAQARKSALDLFLSHRDDGEVLLCALRADSPEAALSFGERQELRTSVIMGLLRDGQRRVACRDMEAERVQEIGAGDYYLPEITVDDTGARLSGAAFYKDHGCLGRLEGQPVRLLCLLDGAKVQSACSLHGPGWAVWLKKAHVERSGGTLHLVLEAAFTEGDPEREAVEHYLAEMGRELFAALREMGANPLNLPEFVTRDYRVAVMVHMP